ncbi:hypothetical protein DRO66_10660, partial [Candidatus Bathyarchaeota archaeon]
GGLRCSDRPGEPRGSPGGDKATPLSDVVVARASAVVYLAYQYPMCPMAWSKIGGGLTLTVMKFWGGKI